jgi:hypothetical protein
MKKFAVVCGVVVLCAVTGTVAYSSGVGTGSDPLVTKSYVDAQIEKIKTSQSQNTSTTTTTQSSQSTATETGYKTVSVPVGKKILGGDGTEIILRAGKGFVYITGKDGIADITTGQNLTAGVSVTQNHLLVVPRGDGRGIMVSEAAWFLVKGDYTIQ